MTTPVLTKRQFLATVEPFRPLPVEELQNLAARSDEKDYSKGETLYSEGEPAEHVWVIRQGRVEIFKYSTTGRPFAIELLGPSELFGILCRLGAHGQSYPCTAIAESNATIIQIPVQLFLKLYRRYQGVVSGVCSLCSERLFAIKDLACLEQEHVQKRVASTLVSLYKRDGELIRFTKREIAELAGTSAETVIRMMSVFAKKGWITSGRGQILVKDLAKLEALLAIH